MTFLDPDLLAFEEVWAAAGTPGLGVPALASGPAPRERRRGPLEFTEGN